MPADAVLLAGTCICDESILTGESTPQWKAPLPEEGAGDTQHLSIKRDKRHGAGSPVLVGRREGRACNTLAKKRGGACMQHPSQKTK